MLQPDDDEASYNVNVNVRMMDNTQRNLVAHPVQTVADFKEQHFGAELRAGKVVRFIASGKLVPDSLSMSSFALKDGNDPACEVRFHCSISPPPTDAERGYGVGDIERGYGVGDIEVGLLHRPGVPGGPSSSSAHTRAQRDANPSDPVSGAGVSSTGDAASADAGADAVADAVADAPGPLGFDRMREMGYSDTEIREFRLQFYASRNVALAQGHNPTTALRGIEEQWLNNDALPADVGASTQTPATARADEMRRLLYAGREGSNTDLFLGVVCGFILGLVIMLWIKEPSIPRRQKIGILAGFGVNVCFGILQITLIH